jgi:hypothetical protein
MAPTKLEYYNYKLPLSPANAYAYKGWKNFRHFLGREYLSFKKARIFVRSLNLKNREDWIEYCRRGEKPDNIPTNPHHVYKNKGWRGWKDFLFGAYLSFEEAREFVRRLRLKSIREWRDYCKSGKRPINIPLSSSVYYKNRGWINWGDFLGKQNRKYLNVKELKISNEETRS